MSCPVCGFVSVAGATQCAACGTQLVAAPKPLARPGDAVCATHQDTPALQPCARCGTFYCAACLERSADAQLYCRECRARSTLPWDSRAQLGTLRAWFQTSTKLLFEPTATLAGTSREGTIASSLLFTVISAVAGFLTTLSLYAVMFGGMAVFAMAQTEKLGEKAPQLGIGFIGMAFLFLAYVGLTIGMQIVMLFVLSGIQHVVLQILGERQLAGYQVTVRAHALGLAPFVIGLIPFCGPFVMGLWSLVLQCLTLVHLQKVTAGKAVVAVITPMVVLCGCVSLMYFMVLAAAFSAAGLATQ